LVISDDTTSERRKIMSKKITILVKICIVVGFIAVLSSPAQANWSETFGGNAFDQTWVWGCYPDVTKTFTHTIKDGLDNDDYLSMDETTPFDTGAGSYGSAFGIGFVQSQTFTDVRVATVVNVTGGASSFYHGLGARASYWFDTTGVTGAPGIVANAYIMHINWEDWPPYLSINIEKVIWDQNTMKQGFDVRVPGLNNARSFYAALDVIGSNPVYVTGYLYEYEGGPLVAKTATLIDTDAIDSWEDNPDPQIPGDEEKVFTSGLSGIFAQNERSNPVGYHTTFDSASSVSDGPVAVCLGPADGAAGVDVDTDLQWVEAAFATSRELWFGKKGAMKKVTPAGATYDPGPLQFAQTYQWQVNEIGPGGTVEGPIWTFTTAGTADGCLLVDDFESYADTFALRTAWEDDVPVYSYGYVETGIVYAGKQTLKFDYQNQYDAYETRLIHTYADPQDWTKAGFAALRLYLYGEEDNYEQKLYVGLEDALSNGHEVPAVPEPYGYAVQNESWQKWVIDLSEFSDNGVHLDQVKKIILHVGDGTNSGQPLEDYDMIYIDQISLCPRRCSLNLAADVDGNCRIDFGDVAAVGSTWLTEGTYELP
jgi:hypothetical protein